MRSVLARKDYIDWRCLICGQTKGHNWSILCWSGLQPRHGLMEKKPKHLAQIPTWIIRSSAQKNHIYTFKYLLVSDIKVKSQNR